MPLYDYRCGTCDSMFEVSHSMNFEGRIRCTSCDSPETYRILSNCRFNTGSDLGPTAGHLMEEQRKQTSKQRSSVSKALNRMSAENNANEDTVHAGCVQHTRMELEERYGKIFPDK